MSFVEPMLLEKREEPFDDPRFVFEPKIDGHRLLLVKGADGSIKLWTRHENDVTLKYPELHNPPVSCSSVVLDGEVAYVDPKTGAIDFESVMERFQMSKQPMIQAGMLRQPVQYFVFDVLEVDGRDVRQFPLKERRAILDSILTENDHFKRVLQIGERGKDLFQVIQQQQLEGIVAKRMDSKYVGRRSPNWIKVINYVYTDVEIAGFRKDEFGWLARKDGKPVGIIELAVPAAHRKAFYALANELKTGEDRNFVYVQPKLRARVRTRNWTKKGMLRTPEFVEFIL